jgi:hypothetical protein
MHVSFIATLVVVATAFSPALCAPLDSSLAAREYKNSFFKDVRAVFTRDRESEQMIN